MTAKKTAKNIIELQDGDQTLRFEIRKMPATKAEDFLYRLAELAGRNLDLQTAVGGADIVRAITASRHEDAKALLDELLFCCWRVVGNATKQVSYDDLDSYVASPLTLMKLRLESAKANFDFFTDFAGWFSQEAESFTRTAER